MLLESARLDGRIERRAGMRQRDHVRFEYERDRYVAVEDTELTAIAPRSSRVMEILEFVPAAEVDPVYLDASYVRANNKAPRPFQWVRQG